MTPPQKTTYTSHTRLLEKSIVSWSRRIHTNDFGLIMISLKVFKNNAASAP